MLDSRHTHAVPFTHLTKGDKMYQVDTPIITSALVEELHFASAVRKPTAMGTPLRYSSSFGCARQQGYAAFEIDPSEPMDEAGAWATGLGTIIHEKLQDAISRKFPRAQFEVPSRIDDISGSCDALVDLRDIDDITHGMDDHQGTHILYELKTMGTYSFDKQVGWNRMRGTVTEGEGPALKAIAQAGMNAVGIMAKAPSINIEWLVMGSITFEALSKNKALNANVYGVNRFLAEYWIPQSYWLPIANEEIERMRSIAYAVDHGYLPDRVAVGDDGQTITLNPNISKFWQCDYCAFRTICQQDGNGQVRIIDSVATQTTKEK